MTETIRSTQPRFETIVPQFTVPGVNAAARYYADVLGFEIKGFFGDPVVFAMVGRGPVEIFFNQGEQLGRQPGPRVSVGYDAYIRVSGVDALAAELKSRGARIVEGPVDRIYGMRELVIDDCHGIRLAFGEDSAERRAQEP